MSLKDFQILSKLGEGAYSTVYKVRRLQDNNIYALKRVKMISLSTKEKQNALNEIRILASIKHINVIAYKQAFIDEASKSLCIVMEFASNGDLAAKIADHQKSNTPCPEQLIWNIFIQLVKGLRQLHELKIFHRDIKTANIFMHDGQLVKLGDMNVSKISEQGLCVTQTGTPYYASPEVWKDQPYDDKSDIWSLGCVLYELIALKVPFKAEDMEGLYKKVTRGIYPRIPSEYSQDLSTIIRSLLQVNPQLRPSCEKILKMAIVQKRMKENHQTQEDVKCELLKTIKAEDFQTINEQFPKANYVSVKIKKAKGMIKNMLEAMEQKQHKHEQIELMYQIESLPILEKDKKIYAIEHSDRVMNRDKLNVHLMSRDRKKSEMAYSRSGLQINRITPKLEDIKELKLPKVHNRCNKTKAKVGKQDQNSSRFYKIFQC